MSQPTLTPILDSILSTPCVDIFSSWQAENTRPCVVPPIVCADGTTLSVQASRTHYCSPRDCDGSWYEVEVGFPSVPVPEWAAYKDGGHKADTETVFGWVPVELVRNFIAAHGGEKQ